MYCRKCGQKLKETSRFCKICGTPVMMESTIEDEVISPMKHKKRWPIVLMIFFGVFLIILAAFVLKYKMNEISEQSEVPDNQVIANEWSSQTDDFETDFSTDNSEEDISESVEKEVSEEDQKQTEETEMQDEASEYFIPDSDSKYLTMKDLEGYSADDCRIARNELFARHGRKFTDENLKSYFESKSWYEGTIEPEDFDDSVFNEYEIANRDLIVEYEKEKGYR